MGNKQSNKSVKDNNSDKKSINSDIKKSKLKIKKMNEIIEYTDEMKNIYSTIIIDIFSKFEFPCIYLLNIGKYKEFDNIYKFGRTDNFIRRYKEHSKNYNIIPIISTLQYIDVDYLSKAELDIKNYMVAINSIIDIEGHEEFVKLTDKQVKSLISIYKDISKKYTTKTDYLQDKINNLNHQIELLNRDNEIKLIKEQHAHEILKKDYEILKKDYELLKLSNH
jgi:hypothetical protein